MRLLNLSNNLEVAKFSSSKRHLYPLGIISVNFGLFGVVRGLAQHVWIQNTRDLSSINPITSSTTDIILLYLAGACCILVQILLRIGMNHSQTAWKLISASLAALQGGALLFVSISFFIKYPPSAYLYSQGGVIAAFSSGVSSSLGALLICLHAALCSKEEDQSLTKPQRGFELSVLTLIIYVLVGGGIFMSLENWDYERSVQFCMVTLLTIGYGNIVARTTWGRLAMILYTTIGIVIAASYVLAFEKLLLEVRKTDDKNSTADLKLEACDDDDRSEKSRDSSLKTNESSLDAEKRPWKSKFAHRLLITSTLLVWNGIWWFSVSAVFSSQEQNWSYLDALYFSFVTMTGYLNFD